MGVLSCISDYLKAYGSELGYRVVEQFPPLHPLSDTVRWLLQRQLSSGRPDIPAVAREIGVSERTLQRRLQHEGTSFQFLLTAVRRARARELLANTALDFGEAAFLLGYEDKNSFFRAFRLWEGKTTPSSWRGMHQNQESLQ